MAKRTILVVDDEPEVRKVLRIGLEAEGYRILEASNRDELFDAVQAETVDLITLDLMLGGEDGLDIARTLRATQNIPVLIITGRASPDDRVLGLESGADDYIVKPFRVREVVLRIRKALETYEHEVTGQGNLRFDDSAFDLKRRVVRHLNGSPVELTGIELSLLELFVRHPGRILSRDDISRALFGRDWEPLDRTIDGHVTRLRHKIDPPDEGPSLIRSVRGIGYVFTGEVSVLPRST